METFQNEQLKNEIKKQLHPLGDIFDTIFGTKVNK